MDQELTAKQTEIVNLFPATAPEIADQMGYSGPSTVYDHVSEIRLRGMDVGQNDDGEYFEIKTDGGATVTNHVEPRRQTAVTKATITRRANEYLTELEKEIKGHRRAVGPAVADGGLVNTKGGQDVVIHRTDDHFGDVVKDENGTVVFDSEIAEHRVRQSFDYALDSIQGRQQLGADVDTVHILLGGDHVTNEAIYDGQAWEVDENIKEQMNRATAIYDDEIERLSKLFPSVQVVCIGGNHGEFRVKGSSNKANADDLFYDRLEMLAVKGDYDNVQFVKSDRKDFVNFRMRVDQEADEKKAEALEIPVEELDPKHQSGFRGHLRHGQFVGNHIGTHSRKNDWRGFLVNNQFDVAYRGHYHEYKCEHVDGRPVMMGGSIKDPGEYANSIGAFGNPVSHIHGVTDENVLEWTEYINFN